MAAMGNLKQQQQPHIVCVAYPAQGHLNPMMQLAKLLHGKGFYITFVNTEFNHRRLLRSRGHDALNGLENFRFETIPDGLPPSDKDGTQDVPSVCDSTKRTCMVPLVDLINNKLHSPSSDIPRVTCIIPDVVMGFGIEAGKRLGIPVFPLWTASGCGFMGYVQYPELMKRGLVPLKDESMLSNGFLDMEIDWIPGMKNMRLKDIPSFIRTTDPNDIMLNFMADEVQNCVNASGVIFNTFDDLEHEVLDAISSTYPQIYTIGSLALLARHIPDSPVKSFRTSLWTEDSECISWLDKQSPNSVFYANFGCVAVMSDQHLKEFAWGLANSKNKFLLITRPDVVMGNSVVLPQEFMEEIKDRGFLATWCPQDLVLSHPSVGGFLTHCGWNSTLENICNGKPVLCWPYFADQQTNCKYLCNEWGIGMEISSNVKREEMEGLVKELMEGEKGKQMRENALKWKEKAIKATEIGGSSYVNFESLIGDIIKASDLPK